MTISREDTRIVAKILTNAKIVVTKVGAVMTILCAVVTSIVIVMTISREVVTIFH